MPEPVGLVEAGMAAVVNGMTIVPAGFAEEDRLAIAAPGLEEDLEQRGAGGVGIVIDPHNVHDPCPHQPIGGGELPFADTGNGVGGEKANIGMVIARHAGHGDGQIDGMFPSHAGEHGIKHRFVDRADPERLAVIGERGAVPGMAHPIGGRIIMVEVPDHLHA